MKPSVSCIIVIIYFIEHSIERILTAPHSVCMVSAGYQGQSSEKYFSFSTFSDCTLKI